MKVLGCAVTLQPEIDLLKNILIWFCEWRCEGYKVATVVVGDDCAVSGGIAGRRGLAGTMFVHKVAGAMAARGDDLATVETVAKQVADRVGTIGVALNVCNLPGVKKPSTRLADDEIEIGLGIHGEAGFEVTKIMPAAPLVRQVIEMIATSGRCYLKKGKEVVLMVNNLGSSTSIELNIVANEACEVLTQEYGIELKAVYVGTFITALDMGGVSLTIFKVTPDMLDLLKHPTKARAWTNEFPEYVARRTLGSLPSSKSMLKDPVRPSVLTPLGSQIEKSILGATAQLIVHEQELTEWDTIVGDGDSGSTMRRGAEQIRSDMLANYPLNNPAGVAQCLAKSITHSTGGTSGALYAIFFTAAAAVLNDLEDQASPAAQDWYWALEAGVETIEQYGGATKGCRTMLDAMIPTTEALKEGISRSEDAVQLLRRAVEAAQDGANATQFMVATAGRSSYVPGKFMELVPDPGAKAFQFWLEGVLAAFE